VLRTAAGIGFELILHLVTHVARKSQIRSGIHPYERTSHAGLPEGFRRDSRHGHRWDVREAGRAGTKVHSRDLGWTVCPEGVPVQIHFGETDWRRNESVIAKFASRVRKAGAVFEKHVYPTAMHHFNDAA